MCVCVFVSGVIVLMIMLHTELFAAVVISLGGNVLFVCGFKIKLLLGLNDCIKLGV